MNHNRWTYHIALIIINRCFLKIRFVSAEIDSVDLFFADEYRIGQAVGDPRKGVAYSPSLGYSVFSDDPAVVYVTRLTVIRRTKRTHMTG